eukprot:4845376-Pyramimonas_sp.AAC.1
MPTLSARSSPPAPGAPGGALRQANKQRERIAMPSPTVIFSTTANKTRNPKQQTGGSYLWETCASEADQ